MSLVANIKAQGSKEIDLSFNKTVHLFFPDTVSYFDIGSSDVLIDAIDNIVKLAPAVIGFSQTNLTIKTNDNMLYSFLINYSESIDKFTYFIQEGEGMLLPGAKKEKHNYNETKQEKQENKDICQRVVEMKQDIIDQGAKNKKILIALTGVYIYQDKLYFQVMASNTSNITYDIEFLRFYITDKKRVKQSSIQDVTIEPYKICNKLDKINANTTDNVMVYVFDKFTISDEKMLVIEMFEVDGGRDIRFEVTEDVIIEAKKIK